MGLRAWSLLSDSSRLSTCHYASAVSSTRRRSFSPQRRFLSKAADMKKPKPRAHKTALDRIAAEIHIVLRRGTKDVITIGKLLTESRKHLKHGGWQNWLADNFDLGYRSAINYCQVPSTLHAKPKVQPFHISPPWRRLCSMHWPQANTMSRKKRRFWSQPAPAVSI